MVIIDKITNARLDNIVAGKSSSGMIDIAQKIYYNMCRLKRKMKFDNKILIVIKFIYCINNYKISKIILK
jgi:hypothetical protein